jgi:hypothetical protein
MGVEKSITPHDDLYTTRWCGAEIEKQSINLGQSINDAISFRLNNYSFGCGDPSHHRARNYRDIWKEQEVFPLFLLCLSV